MEQRLKALESLGRKHSKAPGESVESLEGVQRKRCKCFEKALSMLEEGVKSV